MKHMKQSVINLIFSDKEKLTEICLMNNISYQATQRMIMKYVEHKSYKEIASIEGVEVEAIKQSLYRTRHKIKL